MKYYRVVYLFVLLIYGCNAQEGTTINPSTWNGDPRICTVNPSTPGTDDRPLPTFPNQAEFALERVEVRHVLNITLPSQLTMYQYLYDYNANKLVLVKNANGFIDAEYFYYDTLKKSTYYRGEFCVVSSIDMNKDIDGTSAIQLQDNTWHIRPLNEFLLFSSNDPRRPPIRPRYAGTSIVRGIPVDQWETCIIDRNNFQTFRRVWSFAQKGFDTPTGTVGDLAYPVQAIINASVLLPNGTQLGEFDEVFNVYAYRPGIIETTDQLAPPKGVFCASGSDQNLESLQDARIQWPERFSVRVDASSSRTPRWQRFHLRYDRGRERGSKRIRYDYSPGDGEDFESVIHDYGDNLTYIIDRRVGSCKINRGVEYPDVSPNRDPASFFIKHESRFFESRDKVWEFNGFRSCRGNTIKCAAVTTSVDKFPVIVEPDTDKPSGETWAATNIEYGWSMRAPSQTVPGTDKHFDYPVYLYLKLYRYNDPTNPSPLNIRTEDIEYEFYEMSHEIHPNDFDISLCYRSLNLEYLHLSFILNVDESAIDGNHVDRRLLEREVHANLADKMQIRYSRISELDIFHEHATNDVNVFFTLLGPTPKPESPTLVSDNEPTAAQSRDVLKKSIDGGTFQFTMKFTDDSTTDIPFQAVVGSLKDSKQYRSSHAVGKPVITESYSAGAQAGAVIGGIIVGLAVGILIAAVIRIVRKEPMPDLPMIPTSFQNPLPNISFHNKKQAADAKTTPDA
ncbi:unnamed protein product [Rotaria sordida]|uniref:LolA-like domain-containing protein n=1 Tax=Rotaria sordida TaxID=392033 RepID=A0A814H4I8_9BILA|nr:unnamed protein product [Rotaria sordida]